MEQSIIDYMKEQLGVGKVDIRTYSPLALAYIGDCVFDLFARTIVVSKGNSAVQKYHKRTSALVSAHAQAEMMKMLEAELNEEEAAIYKRGRNSKPSTMAKNASAKEYLAATGMEAVFGYLYLTDQHGRLIDLVKRSIEIWEELHNESFPPAKV